MTIRSNNGRTGIIMPKVLKKRLEELAKEQNRSLNNLMVTILENSTKE